MNLSARTIFRFVAFAEAVSWAALLISMYVKYGPADNPVGVRIFGMVHGLAFIAYLITVLLVRRPFGWNRTVFVVAALSAIPPFCTAVFEVVAERRGLLREHSSAKDRAGAPSFAEAD